MFISIFFLALKNLFSDLNYTKVKLSIIAGLQSRRLKFLTSCCLSKYINQCFACTVRYTDEPLNTILSSVTGLLHRKLVFVYLCHISFQFVPFCSLLNVAWQASDSRLCFCRSGDMSLMWLQGSWELWSSVKTRIKRSPIYAVKHAATLLEGSNPELCF